MLDRVHFCDGWKLRNSHGETTLLLTLLQTLADGMENVEPFSHAETLEHVSFHLGSTVVRLTLESKANEFIPTLPEIDDFTDRPEFDPKH